MCFEYQSEMFTVKCGSSHFQPGTEDMMFEFQTVTQLTSGILDIVVGAFTNSQYAFHT